MKRKKMTPEQGIVLMGTFLLIVGLIWAGKAYITTDQISLSINALVVALMGLLMIYIGKRVEY